MDVITAHGYDDIVCLGEKACLLDVILMTTMDRVVLCNDSCGFLHIAPQKIQSNTPYSTTEMLEIQGRRGYN